MKKHLPHFFLSTSPSLKSIGNKLQQWIIIKEVFKQKWEPLFYSLTQANDYTFTIYIYDAFSSPHESFPILYKAVILCDILDKTDHNYDLKWQSLEYHAFPENTLLITQCYFFS